MRWYFTQPFNTTILIGGIWLEVGDTWSYPASVEYLGVVYQACS